MQGNVVVVLFVDVVHLSLAILLNVTKYKLSGATLWSTKSGSPYTKYNMRHSCMHSDIAFRDQTMCYVLALPTNSLKYI